MAGDTTATRFARDAQYLSSAEGNVNGDTYAAHDSQNLLNQYEALFGPAGRDIKVDSQRNKRHQRWHLPDSIKGYNSFLTDRIDGLITDATNSPFTRNILPYFYLENPDAKIKWNVYSFDEGMASRVPYESAARVLTQTKTSQSGYAIRQGLAIVMEHNFLASDAGRQNFKHQLTQLVGSIQLTNDLDVHIALLQAQSYEKIISEKYYGTERTLQRTGKQFCDMFGIYNKIPNALDLLIEEARTKLKTWGSDTPTFLLCPSNLTLHMTMSPERTDYVTNGPDGLKRLAQGPDLPSYRGLSIIHSQKFSLEAGREPRNVLRRKVRVAEYYWLPHVNMHTNENQYEFYDQASDSFKNFTKAELIRKSGADRWMREKWADVSNNLGRRVVDFADDGQDNFFRCMVELDFNHCDVLVLRPNIEHEMLSVIIGRGGTQELGSTFWGQTEMACYDDAQHGIWGMSYKYHERAIVTNEKNLVRMFDIAFDGYNGGMSCEIMQWTTADIEKFKQDTESIDGPYRGKSMVVLSFPTLKIVDTFLTVNITNADPDQAIRPRATSRSKNNTFDLQRILRRISHDNPINWNRPQRFIEAFLFAYQTEIEALFDLMNGLQDPRGAKITVNSFNHVNGAQYVANGVTYADAAVGRTDVLAGAELVAHIKRTFPRLANQIDAVTNLADLTFGGEPPSLRGLLQYCIMEMLLNFTLETGRTPAQAMLLQVLVNVRPVNPPAIDFAMWNRTILTACSVSCHDLVLALFHATLPDNWNWVTHFYGDTEDRPIENTMDIPNPLILPTLFSPENEIPVFADSEHAALVTDHGKYELKAFLTSNACNDVVNGGRSALFDIYGAELGSVFGGQVNISPGENIRSNTTQIPTLCYHGNMKIRNNGALLDDIKCIGHMGNSHPGMASVREGRGVQSQTLPAQIMHLQ
jgi:hypothetical protein